MKSRIRRVAHQTRYCIISLTVVTIMESELTQSWKRTIQGVAHQSLVQLDPVVLEKIKMLKTNGHGRQVTRKAQSSLLLW
jgi:hypothetical protein